MLWVAVAGISCGMIPAAVVVLSVRLAEALRCERSA